MTVKDGKIKTVTHIHRVKQREGKIETEKLRNVHTKNRVRDRSTQRRKLKKIFEKEREAESDGEN